MDINNHHQQSLLAKVLGYGAGREKETSIIDKQVSALKSTIEPNNGDKVSLSEEVLKNAGQWKQGVTQAVHFLKSFVEVEGRDGDGAGAQTLMQAIDSLQKIDEPISPQRRAEELESKQYVSEYVQLLHEIGAPAGITANFEHVLSVFQALDQARLQELQNNATASYAAVQQYLAKE